MTAFHYCSYLIINNLTKIIIIIRVRRYLQKGGRRWRSQPVPKRCTHTTVSLVALQILLTYTHSSEKTLFLLLLALMGLWSGPLFWFPANVNTVNARFTALQVVIVCILGIIFRKNEIMRYAIAGMTMDFILRYKRPFFLISDTWQSQALIEKYVCKLGSLQGVELQFKEPLLRSQLSSSGGTWLQGLPSNLQPCVASSSLALPLCFCSWEEMEAMGREMEKVSSSLVSVYLEHWSLQQL